MQLAFYFDQTRCVGCYTCAVACKDWNDVPAGPASWRRVSHIEEGEFPLPFVAHMSTSCNHCAEPVCVMVCPASAITKRENDGIVLVDRDKCRQSARCGIITGYRSGVTLSMGEREAPCQITCPAHLRVPAYVALIAKGKFDEALDLIRRNMPLPSVCGRICSHPCESECTRNDVDEPIAIASLRRFVADYSNGKKPKPLAVTKKAKVAIVGSGPSGLAAAYDLARMGYQTTIFEALPVAGGMLAVGIPKYRLPREALQRDIDYIQALGVEIRTSQPIGSKLTLDDLALQGYSATFIASGSPRGTILNMPGSKLNGVISGISFLKDVNTGKGATIGKKVLVLGGGNVAFDCARVALRLGASKVHLACLEATKEMRAFPEEIAEARQEGVIVHPSWTFKRIIGKDGSVVGVECLKCRSACFDEAGSPIIDAIADSEHIFACDTVIMAVGQAPDLEFLKVSGGLELTKRGTIRVNPETMQTSRPDIFAGGDAVVGAGTVIEAIAAGQKAAVYMDKFLRDEVVKGRPRTGKVTAADIRVEIPGDVKKSPRQKAPVLPAASRVKTFDEVTAVFNREAAMTEAQRCLNCAGSLCRDACPYGAPQFGAEENAKMQKCDFCVDRVGKNEPTICVAACPMRALDAGPIENLEAEYGAVKEAAGFAPSQMTHPSVLFKPKK